MDLNRVIGEVAARHGVRLDPDDPALVLVTVTELMLQQAQQEFLATTRRATAEFVEAAGRAQEQAGAALAERVVGPWRADLCRVPTMPGGSQELTESFPLAANSRLSYRWVVPAVIFGVLLFCAGVLVGRDL